jgi:hypothetical protein
MSPPNLPSPPSPSSPGGMEAAISTTMLREEQELLEEREKSDALHEQELLRKRQEDIAAGAPAIDKKFKALDYLLGQSQVRQFKQRQPRPTANPTALCEHHAETDGT